MWSYIYRRYVGDTKICGVIYIEVMWGDTKISGVIFIEVCGGTQNYVELYT